MLIHYKSQLNFSMHRILRSQITVNSIIGKILSLSLPRRIPAAYFCPRYLYSITKYNARVIYTRALSHRGVHI